jgi:hypothetical protein
MTAAMLVVAESATQSVRPLASCCLCQKQASGKAVATCGRFVVICQAVANVRASSAWHPTGLRAASTTPRCGLLSRLVSDDPSEAGVKRRFAR